MFSTEPSNFLRHYEWLAALTPQHVIGGVILDDLLFRWVELDRTPDSIRNVGQMHQRRREMALLDVGVQVLALAAANSLDEVFPVAPAFAARWPRLLLLAKESLVGVVPLDRHVTFRAVEDVADAV